MSDRRPALPRHSVGLLLWLITLPAQAESVPALEEIIVTGSYIRGTPEDAALPVDVIDRETLGAQGDPTLLELVRNLSYTSGNSGELDPTRSSALVATMNLRGLGAFRTRMLLNGRRYPIDVNTLPRTAVERVEVLKDGAAVLYGSDAMAGVVNFITRSGFDGVELRGSYQHIDGSDGDYSLSGIVGAHSGRARWSVSAEWERRSELPTSERDWALLPWSENPEGGWSLAGNPGSYLPAVAPDASAIIGPLRPDPRCETMGGEVVGPTCQFQFTYFYNLVEETEMAKVFGELAYDVSPSLSIYGEALYADVRLEDFQGSPSLPPHVLVSPDRYVDPDHPGLVDLKTQNPALFPDVGPFPGSSQGTFTLSRAIGVAGSDEKTPLRSETGRLVAGVEGSLSDGAVTFDASVSVNRYQTYERFVDALIEKMAFALDGLGGPGCDPSAGTPGVAECSYYNPFSNAIAQSAVNGAGNDQFNADLANSPELMGWLMPLAWRRTEYQGIVLDAVVSGPAGWRLPGGPVSAAAGLQARRFQIDASLSDLLNRAIRPCPFSNPLSVTRGYTDSLDCANETGVFGFLTAADEETAHQDVYAVFAELSLPLSDRLDLQAALRYEHYDGPVSSTLDPKLAISWRPTGWLTLRGSASTTYAAPPPTWLVGSDTFIQFINVAPGLPARATAVDLLGNPDLEPESGVATNLGFIVQTSRFYGSLDWWRLHIDDPFYTASGSQIMDAYTAYDCADGGGGVGTLECDILRTHVYPTGTRPPGLQRIEVSRINGAWETTSGFDLYTRYDFFDVAGGTLSIGTEGTWTDSYRSGPFLEINGLEVGEGGEFAGLLNDATPFTPKPTLKGSVFASYLRGAHSGGVFLRYVDDYRDTRPSVPELARIDAFVTVDVNYVVRIGDSLSISLSAFNLTDENPPRTSTSLNYDALTHSGLGRALKLGLVYRLAR